jgi:hypothetical protein
MDKRVAKRHSRQVARAKAKTKTSQPDVRTPEQKQAAKEASRPETGRGIAGKIAAFARSFKKTPAAETDKAES